MWNKGTVGFVACGESGRLVFAALISAGVLLEEAGGCCELSAVVHHELSFHLSRPVLDSRLGLDCPSSLRSRQSLKQVVVWPRVPSLLRALRRVEIARLLFATVSSQDSEVEWIELLLGKRKEVSVLHHLHHYHQVLRRALLPVLCD